MRPLLRSVSLLLLMLAATTAWSQEFTISVTPDTRSIIVGEKPTFTITATPINGFSSTVNLSVLPTTLSTANIALSPKTINAPYTTTATLTLSPTSSDTGIHTIIVQGKNNAMLRYDTITLTVMPDGGVNQWVLYHTGNSGLPSLRISALAVDSSGTTWIGTNAGLARALPGRAPELVEGIFTGEWVKGITVDTANDVWVFTQSYDHGPVRYDDGVWMEEILPAGAARIALRDINAAAAGPDGSIWAATNEGLVRHSDGVWSQYSSADWESVTSNRIVDVAVTSNGAVWALSAGGTVEKGGAVKFDGTFWTAYSNTALGLPDYTSGQIAVDGDDRAWVITSFGLVSPGDPIIHRDMPGSGNTITSAPNGQLWIGLDEPRFLYAENGDTWTPYSLAGSGLPAGPVPNIEVDRDGNVWVGSVTGLAVLKSGRGPLSHVAPERAIAASRFSIIPNPLGSHGNLQLTTKGGAARVTLHDNVGRAVATLYTGEIAPGTHTLPIELSGIPAGAYMLSITIDGLQSGSGELRIEN